MNKAFEKIIEKLEEMIHPKQLYFCKYARGGCKHLDNDDKDCMECVVENAIEIVKQEAEQYNNGWIPVSERLPEERINPVTHDYYQYPVMFESDGVEDIKYYYFGNGHWRYGLQIMDCYVTHWMNIKPYQPKGE